MQREARHRAGPNFRCVITSLKPQLVVFATKVRLVSDTHFLPPALGVNSTGLTFYMVVSPK